MEVSEGLGAGHPLFDALEGLRELDVDYLAEIHPAVRDDKVGRRVRSVRKVVCAIVELRERGEEVDAASIREEMQMLGNDFVTPVSALLAIERELRDSGDDLNAATIRKAIAWMAIEQGVDPSTITFDE